MLSSHVHTPVGFPHSSAQPEGLLLTGDSSAVVLSCVLPDQVVQCM